MNNLTKRMFRRNPGNMQNSPFQEPIKRYNQEYVLNSLDPRNPKIHSEIGVSMDYDDSIPPLNNGESLSPMLIPA